MISPTLGELELDSVIQCIRDYVNDSPESEYKITIGSDSQNFRDTKVVMVLAIWRVGNGGIFFYEEKIIPKIENLTKKIYYETNLSLEFANKMVKALEESGIEFYPEIHVDIGRNGETNKLIPEIVGWVNGCGYDCKIKPNSYAASWVANKITK